MAINSRSSCYKFPLRTEILGNLSIATDNTSIVLWSKYQLLIYKDANFNADPIIIITPFEVKNVLMHNNHILVLDLSGNLYAPKEITPEELKTPFTIRKQNVIGCDKFKEYIMNFKFEESKSKLYQTDFKKDMFDIAGFELSIPDEDWKVPPCGNIIIVSETIEPKYLKQISHTFKLTNLSSEHYLTVISLDKIHIYMCLIGEPNKKFIIERLYKSHIPVISIKIALLDNVYALLGLSCGTILKIPLSNIKQKPDAFHLNCALYKFKLYEKYILYTDGLKMWKRDITTKSEPLFYQFFVRNVRDFCIIGKRLVCVTFLNLIYSIYIEDSNVYITSHTNNSCLEVKMLKDSESFSKLQETIKKNEDTVTKINKETEYLTALSISNRQDIMDSFIKVTASVFDDFKDLEQEKPNLTLTDELNDYNDTNFYYILLNVSVSSIQHKLNKLLSDILGNAKIHITLLSAQRVLKTTSIQITEQLKTKNYVISLHKSKIKDICRVHMLVKIVSNIPAQLDNKLRQWIILYRKCFFLNAENFIKTISTKGYITLKEDDASLETIICKRAEYLHGTLYRFSPPKKPKYQWSLCVKLPSNYMQILSTHYYYINYLDSKRSDIFLNQSIGNTKKWIEFQVGDDQVILNIEYDDLTSTALMKILCSDINIATDIRNLFSRVIFSSYCGTSTEFVNHKLYTDIENLKMELQNFSLQGNLHENFIRLLMKFNRIIYCSLPI